MKTRILAVIFTLGLVLTLVVITAAQAEIPRFIPTGGPFGGHVTALAVDSFDSRTIYAGTFQGGVFKSLDGGLTWRRSSRGLPAAGLLWVRDLAIDPTDSAVVYAAVGDFTATAGPVAYKSTDGGSQWEPLDILGDAAFGTTVFEVEVDPADPRVVYALVSGRFAPGLHKSDDGGVTWRLTNQAPGFLSDSPLAAVLAEDGTSHLYTVSRAVWRSTDRGESWQQVSPPFEGVLSGESLAFGPVDRKVILAGSSRGTVLRSADGGVSWQEVDVLASPTDFYRRIAALAVDPADADRLWAGIPDNGLYESRDGGDSWSKVAAADFASRRVLALAAAGTTLIAGSGDGGITRRESGGWRDSNAGLTNAFVNVLEIERSTDPPTLYAGLEGGGVHRSADGGANWTALGPDLEERFARALAIEPGGEGPPTLYAALDLGIVNSANLARSLDGGASWQAVDGLQVREIRALATDPAASGTVWAATRDGLFKSTDAALSWQRRPLIDERGESRELIDVVVLPATGGSPATVLTLTGTSVWRSADGGTSFERHILPRPSGYRTLAIGPGAGSGSVPSIWVGGVQSLSRSLDGGATWRRIRDRLPVTLDAMALDPTAPGILYGAGQRPFYSGPGSLRRSVDGGHHFSPIGYGLFETPVAALALDSTTAPPTLYAGTSGGGVFTARPDRRQTFIHLLKEDFRVEIEWHDALGHSGEAEVVGAGHRLAVSDDSALFYFFSPQNWEILVKVLDGCAVNGHVWVFAAATTDVGYTLTVTDVRTGEAAKYENPLGYAADAITDTSAFATCGME